MQARTSIGMEILTTKFRTTFKTLLVIALEAVPCLKQSVVLPASRSAPPELPDVGMPTDVQEWLRLLGFSINSTKSGRAWKTETAGVVAATTSLNVFIATPELSESRVRKSQTSKEAKYSPCEATGSKVLPRAPSQAEQHVNVAWFETIYG